MSVEDGGPAFPAHDYVVGELSRDQFQKLGATRGMTLRDYFAAAALTGMCAYGEQWAIAVQANGVSLYKMAYAHADAMLKQREAK